MAFVMRSRGRPALAAVALVLASCAGVRRPSLSGPAKVLTVEQLSNMVLEGALPAVMYGEIESSGTVYRLTLEQYADVRADGMPASVISYMKLTYDHAIKQNPELARSDAGWTRIGNYWYGGTPFGWPKEWVVGAPPLGAAVR
jgi:hypothetical protein